MNKKIASEIAIGIILLITVIFGTSVYLSGKKEIRNNIGGLSNSLGNAALPSSGYVVLKSGESATGDIDGQRVTLMNTGGGHSTIKVDDSPSREVATTEKIADTLISLISRDDIAQSITFLVVPPNQNSHNEITATDIANSSSGALQGMETPTATFTSGEAYPPAGFLVPTETSIPEEYKKFLQHNGKDLYAIQYNVGEDRYFVSEYTETEKDNCTNDIAQQADYMKRQYKDTVVKEFTFQGLSGTTVRDNFESHLFLKDGNRCLKISNYGHNGEVDSADTLIAELGSFKRQEVSDNKTSQNQSDSTSALSLSLAEYSDDSYKALSLDSQQVVTGYLWHSYKESPNFSSVTLPQWGTYVGKDDTKTEYNIDIWDGKSFVFYMKTTPGKEIVFPQGGVYEFRVTGIDPSFRVCPSDRGYLWGMKFASAGTFNGIRVPLADKGDLGKTCVSNNIH